MAYTYPAVVAWDPVNKQVVKGTTFYVYDPTDTGFTSPLPITDPFGNSLPYLNSGTMGVFPQFQQATAPTVVVSDAAHAYAWTYVSIQPPQAGLSSALSMILGG